MTFYHECECVALESKYERTTKCLETNLEYTSSTINSTGRAKRKKNINQHFWHYVVTTRGW